jgi:Ca-activated chloride channel family protein
LTVARDAAARFIAGREHDRIGLVLFARYPDLRCPPTTDHDALQQILAAAATVDSDGQEDATGIGTAIARAAQVLAESRAPSKVVILLTDGDENVATERAEGEITPVHAGQLCRQLGVRVYTISAVPTSQADATPDAAPQDSQVRRLSELTGGRFFAARDAASVDGVYAAIADLERAQRPAPRFVFLERFTGFALAGTLLIVLGRLLGLTVWRTLP